MVVILIFTHMILKLICWLVIMMGVWDGGSGGVVVVVVVVVVVGWGGGGGGGG